jgi:AraC-like DNA-binding protein
MLVCFCRSGEAVININYTTHLLKANEVLIILPTHIFWIESMTNDFRSDAIFYSEEYWTAIAQSINYPLLKAVELFPKVEISDENQGEVFGMVDMVRNHERKAFEKASVNEIELSIAGSLAYSVLMMGCLAIDSSHTDLPMAVSRKESLTRDFFDLLSQHYEQERSVAFYASELCVTPKYLSTMVKDVTKRSILEWINNVTILSIKHKLRTTNDTVQQISEDLNFQTPSTFIRFFRQHTGVTPLKYRNSF